MSLIKFPTSNLKPLLHVFVLPNQLPHPKRLLDTFRSAPDQVLPPKTPLHPESVRAWRTDAALAAPASSANESQPNFALLSSLFS